MGIRTPEKDPDDSRPQTVGGPPPAPRWVKVALVATVVVVLLLVVVALVTGGQHGPGRHTSDAGDRSISAPAGELR